MAYCAEPNSCIGSRRRTKSKEKEEKKEETSEDDDEEVDCKFTGLNFLLIFFKHFVQDRTNC